MHPCSRCRCTLVPAQFCPVPPRASAGIATRAGCAASGSGASRSASAAALLLDVAAAFEHAREIRPARAASRKRPDAAPQLRAAPGGQPPIAHARSRTSMRASVGLRAPIQADDRLAARCRRTAPSAPADSTRPRETVPQDTDCGAPPLRTRPACSMRTPSAARSRSAADRDTAAGRDRTRRARRHRRRCTAGPASGSSRRHRTC